MTRCLACSGTDYAHDEGEPCAYEAMTNAPTVPEDVIARNTPPAFLDDDADVTINAGDLRALLAALSQPVAVEEGELVEKVARAIERHFAQKFGCVTEAGPSPVVVISDPLRFNSMNLARAALEASALKERLAKVEGALTAFVEAWESLPGNRHYSAGDIQRWISGPMKRAADTARAALQGEQSR